MRPTQILVAIAGAVFLAQLVTNLVTPENPTLHLIIGDLSSVVVAVCATGAFWINYRGAPDHMIAMKQYLPWTVLALVSFTLGEIYWAYEELILKVEVPLGSLSDLFWSLAYPLLFISIYKAFDAFEFAPNKLQKTMLLLTGVAVLAYIAVRLGHAIGGVQNDWRVLLQELYPLYDVLLIGYLLAIVLPTAPADPKGFLLTPGGMFSLFVLGLVVFDIAFAFTTSYGTYHTGHFIDSIYTLAYVFATFSADLLYRTLVTQKPTKER